MLERLQRTHPFIIGCSSQGEDDHNSNSANHVELRQHYVDKKHPTNKKHATHCNTSTSVTSVDSTWETQSWVHQPKEIHAHLAVDFLHLPLPFKGQNAMQKNDQADLKNGAL